MSKQSSLYWDDSCPSFHHDISIRNEYSGFACMFCVFTFLAFSTTIFLSILAYNAYNHDSEIIQRRFIPYSVLGLISVILFFIFTIGSFAYTCKLLKRSHSKQTSMPPLPLPRQLENSTSMTQQKPNDSFPRTTNESYYINTKASAEQESRSLSISYQACQTDV